MGSSQEKNWTKTEQFLVVIILLISFITLNYNIIIVSVVHLPI